MERRGSNHFTARHPTNLKTNANTINYSAKAGRRASLGWKRPSFPLVKGPPGNPLLRTCPPRQGYGWENYTVSHEQLVNHNTAAKFAKRPIPLRIMNRRIANSHARETAVIRDRISAQRVPQKKKAPDPEPPDQGPTQTTQLRQGADSRRGTNDGQLCQNGILKTMRNIAKIITRLS